MINKKMSCVLLSVIFVFFLSSCNRTRISTSESPSESFSSITSSYSQQKSSFSIAYNNTKSLNPFKTDSYMNIGISDLICDSLAKRLENNDIALSLSECITSSENRLSYVVTLCEGITFSDGTAITAKDVIDSVYAIQKNTSGFYYSCVANVSSVSQLDDRTVIFTLSRPNNSFERLLVFPIIKQGSCEENFIASGSYKMIYFNDEPIYLEHNNNSNVEVKTKRIDLYGTSNPSELHYLLESSLIDYYYTSSSSITTGSFSSNECLGIKHGYFIFGKTSDLLMEEGFIKSFLKTVNIKELIKDNEMNALSDPSCDDNVPLLDAFLESSGYTQTDRFGYKYKQNGKVKSYATFAIAYYSSNKITKSIAKSLGEILRVYGINTTVTEYADSVTMKEQTRKMPADMLLIERKDMPDEDIYDIINSDDGLAAPLLNEDIILNDIYNNYQSSLVGEEQWNSVLSDNITIVRVYTYKVKTLYSRNFAEALPISPYTMYCSPEKWCII